MVLKKCLFLPYKTTQKRKGLFAMLVQRKKALPTQGRQGL
jgi:hypothetical protein